MLFQLKFDDEIVQNFSNAGETMRPSQQGRDSKDFQSDRSSVFRVIQNRTRSPRGMKESVHLRGSANQVSSAVSLRT